MGREHLGAAQRVNCPMLDGQDPVDRRRHPLPVVRRSVAVCCLRTQSTLGGRAGTDSIATRPLLRTPPKSATAASPGAAKSSTLEFAQRPVAGRPARRATLDFRNINRRCC
jgi:hypothetical protein